MLWKDQSAMDKNVDHWSVQIPEVEKLWIKQILAAMCSQTLNFDTAALAVELAYKKGYAEGRNGKR
jgi:hypothetical protein